ncbi:hypothetical protein SAMN05216257_101579 [Meinhardsimonia xiamenensis]|jgi:hypothetical protein|uniref:Ferrochelatase n=1 Tax=Meinhardsimonia xiamenensis TaxID=990712 RepID=A0A1G8Z4U9_9RHOB|nr:hypothetical protein [Meinhardsimonia xiamenensis]PRX37554.1 hypothetical protein LV81_01334 [Meinhardsimonia xiamenensis]SDK10056.1 hypothetical protein SAMN05216257_101579 [Meinhardsimonia xiamenensis]
MKKAVLAIGLSMLVSTAAWADGPGAPMMEPEVVRTETAATASDSWVVLLLTAAVVAAALSN